MYYRNQPPKAAGNPTLILVLSLLGFPGCFFCSIAAWIMGNTYVSNCRNMGFEPEGSGVAGRLIGMITTISLAVGIIVYFLVAEFVFGGRPLR